MEWQQLIGFYQTAVLRSFTKAGKATLRTQSALSQQIKALEEELDCLLFERIGKRDLRLTQAGERLFRFAEMLVKQQDEMIEDIHEIKGDKRGRLRIGAQFAVFYYSLPAVIQSYMERFPHVSLILLERAVHDIVPLVKSGDIDFGIALESVIPRDLKSIRWREAEVVLVTPLDHPLAEEKRVTPEKIAQYPLIFQPKNQKNLTRNFLENTFLKRGINYHVAMEASTIELGSKYVEMGLGISIAISGFGLESIKSRRVKFTPVDHLFDPNYICVVMRMDKQLQPHKQAFVDLMMQ
jgi:DNA-binding transcriptional LysR family regulator